MTSSEIRQSFLDFFRSKQHTIVPSSSLMPDAPNLLFTNAGMNQFVPIFLGQQKADVDKWPGAIPGMPTRAADTQKCIRAGGKHNDLDDVGLDTYHHTFFEMLGNWSFGDYFKKEAIDWAWELITEVWKFPKNRLYATVYNPDKSIGDPSDFDQEAYDFWAAKFSAADLDPKVHVVFGNKKDNFWMMGETGPCGPCSEIHVDLTPRGDTRGALVNKGSAQCIEIWNLVFIQFNANPDGTFSPLPARHVDTGMGFERVTGIIQNTKGFTDFSRVISNYETDIFRPIFEKLETLSGKKYSSTLPSDGRSISGRDQIAYARNPQLQIDIAFRVIADHIRTLSFAIADGIQPGNTDRNYVLRRILRRAVRYGRTLGFHEPFFYKLVNVIADVMGDVFPEIRTKKKHVLDVIYSEEEAFNRTLDNGLSIFEERIKIQPDLDEVVKELHESSFIDKTREDLKTMPDAYESAQPVLKKIRDRTRRVMFGSKESGDGDVLKLVMAPGDALIKQDVDVFRAFAKLYNSTKGILSASGDAAEKLFQDFTQTGPEVLLYVEKSLVEARLSVKPGVIPGAFVFLLYDTYGFPLDLTELIARERGLAVDNEGFNKLMEEQRARARAAQKKTVITVDEGTDLVTKTDFVGFDTTTGRSRIAKVMPKDKQWAVVLPESVFYAEMGGQVGDAGIISAGPSIWRVVDTKKVHQTWLHIIEGQESPENNTWVEMQVDAPRRNAIQRHHTVTHLFHWALHEVVTREATQKGSYVGPEKLTFDFNSAPLTPGQINDIEKLVNERILENASIWWNEFPYSEVKNRKDVMQFFGDKYGDRVRVVQIGGRAGELNGYSMELCGGTHTRATGEIGLFRIVGESAIAAGVRRIEAVAGLEAYRKANDELQLLKSLAGKVNSPVGEVDKKIESLLSHQKELEKQVKSAEQREASNVASNLKAHAVTSNGVPSIVRNLGAANGDFLQAVADALKGTFKGVVVLGGLANGAVSLVATVSPDFTSKVQAGKIVQAIAPIVGGKGGGKPDNARGGGKDAAKLDEALAKAKTLL